MKAIENILQNKFGGSKNLPIFVVPKFLTSVKSFDFTGNRSNKAEFFLNIFSSQRDETLASFQKGFASFVIHIPQIFSFKMPKSTKNLNAAALGASCSTVRNRNSAPVVTQSATTQSQPTEDKISPTPYSLLKEREALNRALKAAEKATQKAARMTAKQLYRISINCTALTTFSPQRSVGIYHTDLYPAISRYEAVGSAVVSVANNYPDFNVDIKSIKCEVVNPSML
ncbi:MAG: hypothetical protein RR354_07540 [Mucinivorans sp.]